jgi:hypothetical protein
MGAASRTTASTAEAPANDCAPSWPVSWPTCSEMTAPNGMETRMVGMIVTLAMNHACSTNSRNWKGRRGISRVTSAAIAANSPERRSAPVGAKPTQPHLLSGVSSTRLCWTTNQGPRRPWRRP